MIYVSRHSFVKTYLGSTLKNIRICHVNIKSMEEKEECSGNNINNNNDNNDNNNSNNIICSNSNLSSNKKTHTLNKLIEGDHKKLKEKKENSQTNTKTHNKNEKNENNENGENDLYYLREHRPGDTAPLPVKHLREEFQNSSLLSLNCAKVIHVKYSYNSA